MGKMTQDEGTSGELAAPSELTWEDIPQLMDELRDLAQGLLRRWPGTGSLQPTLLVDTALRRQRRVDQPWGEVTWETRAQLFSQVFRAMRQKLVEYRRQQQTRGYQAQRRVSVSEMELFESWRGWTEDTDLALALEVGLERLASEAPELSKLVEYRFFSGLTWDEVAQMLECSPATAKRWWKQARLLMEESIRKNLEGPPAR
jgi:DNA-directed RNA polymerase specialized sigma24 family protein